MKSYLFLFIFLPFLINAQNNRKTLTYDLIHKGKIVGSLKATQTINGDIEEYTVNTEITKKVLHVKQCTYDLNLKYKGGELESSDYKLYVNDKLDKSTKIEKKGATLEAYKNNKKKKLKKDHVNYSSALLYFKEPTGVKETFSETKLKSRSIAPHKSKPHTYVLDKNSGEYYYENGVLQRMVYDDIVKVELIRKK